MRFRLEGIKTASGRKAFMDSIRLVIAALLLTGVSAGSTEDSNLFLDIVLEAFLPDLVRNASQDPLPLADIRFDVVDYYVPTDRTTFDFSGGRLIGLASKVRRHGHCTRPRLLAERVTLECELTLDGVTVTYNGSYRAPGKDGKMQNISVELIVLNTYAVVRVASKEDDTPVLNNFRIPKVNLKLKDTGFSDFAQSDNVRQTLRRSVQKKLSSVLFQKFRKTLEEALQSVLMPIA
ncbi:uncharacterized protein LOC135378703 [Ornithodoros turicata]|uniref:uncharacterized protein LOC135378703 n=1 Tax=Ornithodoros turicata TaxID=34597 RepID=UPI00313912C7